MTDLISRQAALDNAWQVMYKDEWYMTQTEQVVSVNDIEALPTIDAVPVVRCKECKYNYGKEHGGEFNPEDIVCDYWATDGLNADDFCSYGERSEE